MRPNIARIYYRGSELNRVQKIHFYLNKNYHFSTIERSRIASTEKSIFRSKIIKNQNSYSNSLSKLPIQNPYPNSLFKFPIQTPYSKSPFTVPVQIPKSKSPFKISNPSFKVPIQNPHSKSLFKTPIQNIFAGERRPPRFWTCSFRKLRSFPMPYSFSSRISLKFLKKSAKSQKNAFSQRPRAVNMVYQLPAISNLPYTLFLILNENLIPTYQYSARILRANFHTNYLNGALLH